MPRIKDYIYTAAAFGCLAGLPSTLVAEELTGSAIEALHGDKCVSYWGPSRGTQCFGADGRTNYIDRRFGRDSGQWEMRGDEMCVFWNKEPLWACGPIWRVDAETYTDGEYTWTID